MKNVKFKIMKIRTGCQYVGCFYYTENLNWTAQNLRLGRGLDVAGLVALYKIICLQFFICIFLSVPQSVLYYDIKINALGMLQKSRTPTAGVANLMHTRRQFFPSRAV